MHVRLAFRWTLPVAALGVALLLASAYVGTCCLLVYADECAAHASIDGHIRDGLAAVDIPVERHADIMVGVDDFEDLAGPQWSVACSATRLFRHRDARLRGSAFGSVVGIAFSAIGYWFARRKEVARCDACGARVT